MLFADADGVAVANLITTIILAILTATYVVYTGRLVLAQTDPCVIVYAENDESRPSILLVIIKNVGNGIACNVRFELSEPFFRAFGLSPGSETPPDYLPGGAFIDGIPILQAGGTRKIVWGQYAGLKKVLGERFIRIKCQFERMDQSEIALSPPKSTECILELASFAHQDIVDPDGARQSAKVLEKIADILAKQLS